MTRMDCFCFMAFILRKQHTWHYVGCLKTQVGNPQTFGSEESEDSMEQTARSPAKDKKKQQLVKAS